MLERTYDGFSVERLCCPHTLLREELVTPCQRDFVGSAKIFAATVKNCVKQ